MWVMRYYEGHGMPRNMAHASPEKLNSYINDRTFAPVTPHTLLNIGKVVPECEAILDAAYAISQGDGGFEYKVVKMFGTDLEGLNLFNIATITFQRMIDYLYLDEFRTKRYANKVAKIFTTLYQDALSAGPTDFEPTTPVEAYRRSLLSSGWGEEGAGMA